MHLLQLLEKAAPNVSAIYLLLAEAAIRYGAHEVAKEALDKLAASGSRKPHIAYRIALKQLEMGELSAAERTLRIAIEQFPDSWLIWRLLAALHLNQGRTKDAIRCVNRQIASSPTERVRLSGIDRLADCLENIGDRRKASTLYWRIIETVPEYALSYFRLVLCQPSLNSTSPLERILVRTIESGSVPELESRHMHYALGHLYDRAGRVTDAISHFHRANALRARVAGGLNVEAVRAEVDARIAGFDTNRIKTFRKYGCQDDFPIFVVGMPRSGTTLVEQILSSHSKVHGLGERRDILYAVKSLPRLLRSKLRYPWCASQLTPEVVKNLSMSIASDFRKSAGASPRVVTKRPEDCFELGLISILFGNARIIDCRRHPIDTCLSCYMQNFAEVPYATNLEHLAEVYRLYCRVMRHWHTVLPPSHLFQVSYEELVRCPRDVIPKLCDFCGLTPEENCFRFHANDRAIDTASRWQVRQPLYRKSLERWRRYGSSLGPLLSLAEDAVTASAT